MSTRFWQTHGAIPSSTPLSCSLSWWTLMRTEWMPSSRSASFHSTDYLFQLIELNNPPPPTPTTFQMRF